MGPTRVGAAATRYHQSDGDGTGRAPFGQGSGSLLPRLRRHGVTKNDVAVLTAVVYKFP
jgi:hypothetical protein